MPAEKPNVTFIYSDDHGYADLGAQGVDPDTRPHLAAQQPAKVKALNALIAGFLRDTGAVVPVRNPNYDPKAAVPPAGPKARGKKKQALPLEPPPAEALQRPRRPAPAEERPEYPE